MRNCIPQFGVYLVRKGQKINRLEQYLNPNRINEMELSASCTGSSAQGSKKNTLGELKRKLNEEKDDAKQSTGKKRPIIFSVQK